MKVSPVACSCIGFCASVQTSSAFTMSMNGGGANGNKSKQESIESKNVIPSSSSSTTSSSSRRSFIGQTAFAAGLVTSSASLGLLLNVEINEEEDQHGSMCDCRTCVRFGPSAAMALESGIDTERSADYYAQRAQQNRTNERLVASGYKLDTKEEEESKMKDAFASFSYDKATSSKPGKKGGNDKK
mmetsp:Transcript_27235/g.33670  ORF Transcript_27235/g.33670 Transcript_27235/m.33670 type:complete len:186 (+) Transcript_27235:100-657(+)